MCTHLARVCLIGNHNLQALFGVAERSLMEIPDVDPKLRESIAQHMAYVHLSVAEESKR